MNERANTNEYVLLCRYMGKLHNRVLPIDTKHVGTQYSYVIQMPRTFSVT
jgi:hypothetical protein